MRRTNDLNIEAERVVPPIVEGRGGDHHHPAPTGQEGAQRAAESPNSYRGCFSRGVMSPGGGKNQVGAGKAHQDSAELDEQVSGSPESVASDAHVPGNIPVEAEDDRAGADEAAPDVPRSDARAGFGCSGVADC